MKDHVPAAKAIEPRRRLPPEAAQGDRAKIGGAVDQVGERRAFLGRPCRGRRLSRLEVLVNRQQQHFRPRRKLRVRLTMEKAFQHVLSFVEMPGLEEGVAMVEVGLRDSSLGCVFEVGKRTLGTAGGELYQSGVVENLGAYVRFDCGVGSQRHEQMSRPLVIPAAIELFGLPELLTPHFLP